MRDPAPRPVDVVVVGAGPAGAATAITLACAGREVVVADRATFPREKVCGDGLTTSALRELQHLGLDPRTVRSWVDVGDVVVRSPSGRTARFALPDGQGRFAAVARRSELDKVLVELAAAHGAEIHQGRAWRHLEVIDGTSAVGQVDGIGPLVTRHVVAADGMWSPTRKALGLAEPGYRGEWHALRQYFTDVSPRAASELVVWFEPDLLPGYVWSFPIGGGRTNVGYGITRGGSYAVGDMGSLWREVLARPHIRDHLGPTARPESPHRAWPIPARVDRTILSHGPVLFVGDAAAATDPMTGEGIGQALLTGRWAAEAILAASPDAAAVAARYAAVVEAELAVDHRLADQLLRILRHRRGAQAAVRVAAANEWTRRNFARWLFEDYPRALLLTPSRWRRGVLHGPGAYRSATPETASPR